MKTMEKSRMNGGFEVLNYKTGKKLAQILVLLSVFVVLFNINAFAQEDDDEFPEYIPPPKIELSKDEKTALGDEKDTKKFTKLAIDLMDLRLKKAEDLAMNQMFNEVLQELGGFHALMNSTMQFLRQNNTGRGKSLDNYKRYEMALRSFMPRLETIRREVPSRHETYVVKLLRLVRDNRTKAVQPLFSDTVVADDN